ncbi:MAG TPA: HNH endonuclease [Streptosporangiaceae bacterium]|nr:HNH endonuclease [Streptosporangiaceae bacterium]
MRAGPPPAGLHRHSAARCAGGAQYRHGRGAGFCRGDGQRLVPAARGPAGPARRGQLLAAGRPVSPQYGGENRLDNGLLLRSDVHRMFDLGYLSVDTRYRLRVSSRLRTEFGNGEAFYAKEGTVITLPDRRSDQPNADFLQWHMDTKFKAS